MPGWNEAMEAYMRGEQLPMWADVYASQYPKSSSMAPHEPTKNGKGIFERITDRAKEAIDNPSIFWKHMMESGDLKDHLNDFYNPAEYEDYKKHEANAEYVNENYPYLYRFLAKEMSRRIACEERNKDKNNPKWRKDNNRCD